MEFRNIKKIDAFVLSIPVLLGTVSMILWLTEIIYRVGWNGIEWIVTDLKSVYLLTLLAVLSYVLPMIFLSKVKVRNTIISLTLLYLFSLLGYFATKWIFRQLFDKIGDDTHVLYVWLLIFDVTVIAAIFYYTKQYFLLKSERFHLMTIVAVFISIVPASLISIEWVKGFASTESFVDAVKMGYPVFWLNILLGWVSYAMAKRII
jgi:hypothetical protein